MKIEPGFIGWDRGLSLAWGRSPFTRYVSLAWDRWIIMLSWGVIPRSPVDQNRPGQ